MCVSSHSFMQSLISPLPVSQVPCVRDYHACTRDHHSHSHYHYPTHSSSSPLPPVSSLLPYTHFPCHACHHLSSLFFSFSFPSSFSSSPCISSLAPPAQQDRRQSEAACGGSCPHHLNHLRSHSPRRLRRLHRRRIVQRPAPVIMGGCAHHRSGSVCMDAAG